MTDKMIDNTRRVPLIVANWKMNLTASEAAARLAASVPRASMPCSSRERMTLRRTLVEDAYRP